MEKVLVLSGECVGVAMSKYVGWRDMASAEPEPITGVWRRSDPLLSLPL